jgi:hypothetical protein
MGNSRNLRKERTSFKLEDYIGNTNLIYIDLLGTLEKLRTATIRFIMSVRPFTRNNSAPTGQIFTKFDIQIFSENLLGKFKFHYHVTKEKTFT